MYGPNPHMMRQKRPSGHWKTSGVTSPGWSDCRIYESETWKSFRQNWQKSTSFVWALSADDTKSVDIICNDGKMNFWGWIESRWEQDQTHGHTSYYYECCRSSHTGANTQCATGSVVLSLPRTISTNKAPCVVGFLAIISFRPYLSIYQWRLNVHLLLVSKPNHQTLSIDIGEYPYCCIAEMVHSWRNHGSHYLPTYSWKVFGGP